MYADAVKAARKLTALLGRHAEIAAGEETNTVFVRANAATTRKAREILKRLDEPSYLYVIPLQNLEAARTAGTLRMVLGLLTLLSDDREVQVAAAWRGNSILLPVSEGKAP